MCRGGTPSLADAPAVRAAGLGGGAALWGRRADGRGRTRDTSFTPVGWRQAEQDEGFRGRMAPATQPYGDGEGTRRLRPRGRGLEAGCSTEAPPTWAGRGGAPSITAGRWDDVQHRTGSLTISQKAEGRRQGAGKTSLGLCTWGKNLTGKPREPVRGHFCTLGKPGAAHPADASLPLL